MPSGARSDCPAKQRGTDEGGVWPRWKVLQELLPQRRRDARLGLMAADLSLARDHHLGGLDDRQRVVAALELELVHGVGR